MIAGKEVAHKLLYDVTIILCMMLKCQHSLIGNGGEMNELQNIF